MRKGLIPKETYNQLAYDLSAIDTQEFTNFNDDQVFPIEEYGKYFPALVKNPKLFVQEQLHLRETLNTFINKGIKLFLIGDGHF